jgi:hypothetical protein
MEAHDFTKLRKEINVPWKKDRSLSIASANRSQDQRVCPPNDRRGVEDVEEKIAQQILDLSLGHVVY